MLSPKCSVSPREKLKRAPGTYMAKSPMPVAPAACTLRQPCLARTSRTCSTQAHACGPALRCGSDLGNFSAGRISLWAYACLFTIGTSATSAHNIVSCYIVVKKRKQFTYV